MGNNYHFSLSIMHLLVIAPLFLFIGFQRTAIPDWLYIILFVLGIFILIYHGSKLTMRIKNNSGYWWVNAFHVGIVAPLLLYIGYYKKTTPRFAYELLLMLGFAVIGYHLFSIVRFLEIHPDEHFLSGL